MSSMQGKVAFISGGTSGINLAIAAEFAACGAAVLVFGRDPEKAKAAAAKIREETGGIALDGAADVRDPAALASLFAAAAEKLGAPDIVIAGAAGNFPAPAVSISPNGFKTVVDIDLLGTYNTFKAGFDVGKKPASYIAITAPQGTRARPLQVHVCAAKAGVNMVVRVLAMEWGPAGIRVNAISPGPIADTEGVDRIAPDEEAKDKWRSWISLRRFGTGKEIAETAKFLCSEAGSYINGVILPCDGGAELGDASGDYLTPIKRK